MPRMWLRHQSQTCWFHCAMSCSAPPRNLSCDAQIAGVLTRLRSQPFSRSRCGSVRRPLVGQAALWQRHAVCLSSPVSLSCLSLSVSLCLFPCLVNDRYISLTSAVAVLQVGVSRLSNRGRAVPYSKTNTRASVVRMSAPRRPALMAHLEVTSFNDVVALFGLNLAGHYVKGTQSCLASTHRIQALSESCIP